MAERTRPAWITLLELKLGRDADAWLAERHRYQSFRAIAAEASDLTGHPIGREAIRGRLAAIEEHTDEKARAAS